jgi:hypothetical protein
MSYNMMIGYDIYDRFTMEHFLLCQNMISRPVFFARDSIKLEFVVNIFMIPKTEVFASKYQFVLDGYTCCSGS